ncbi:MAG: hypothetical protein ACIAQF_10755 [Phycisphaerales bacterium JB065]
MQGFAFALIAVAVLVLIVLGAIYSHKKRQERIAAMQALADRLGWRFSEHKDRDHDEQYSHFEIFRRGHSRAAYDTLSGSLTVFGQSCFAKAGDFTYKITRRNGKSTSTTTYHFSYLIIELPFHGIPDVLARRENLFDKFTDMLGFDDIDFESSEFSKKFCIKSPDKRFAYDLFTPRMMEFFLEGSPVPGLPAIDLENSRICLSNGSSIWKPEQFEQAIAWAERFFENWPEHLLETLRERGK